MGLHFLCAAAGAAVEGDQFAALGVELPFSNNFPFMKAAAAQRFALVLLLRAGAFERNNVIRHGVIGHKKAVRCGKKMERSVTAPIQKAIQSLGLRIAFKQVAVEA